MSEASDRRIHRMVEDADKRTSKLNGGESMSGVLESNGKTSSMRVAMFLCIGTASYLAIGALHLGADMLQITGLVVTFLGAGIGGKVVQKGSEG